MTANGDILKKHPIKWAVFAPKILSETSGGNLVYVDGFTRSLVRSGDVVHIYTTTNKAELPRTEEAGGIRIHRVFVKSGDCGCLNFSTTRQLTDLFIKNDARERYDLVNVHSAFLVDLKRVRKDLKLVVTLHASMFHEYLDEIGTILANRILSFAALKQLLLFPVKCPAAYLREAAALKAACRIIVMSRYVKKAAIALFPFVDESKIFVSRIGVDGSVFKPCREKSRVRELLPAGKKGALFFTARRLVPRMGLENLVEAFALVMKKNPERDLNLVIAGKGELHRRIQRRIDCYQLNDKIRMLGYISEEELLRYYQAADAFVLPTASLEGFGIVSIEALACNLPVIATPAGAIPEIVNDFCPELLCASPKAESIAERMAFFLKHADSYRDANYAPRVKAKYDWDAIVKEIRALF